MIGAAIRPGRLAATALVAAGLLATDAAPAPAPSPLTNEDIVRLVVHGTSEAAILRAIAGRPPDFDLEPGVVVELERVGVPPAIIEAMRRRMLDAGAGRPAATPSGAPVPAPGGGAAAAPAGSLALRFAASPAGDPAPELFAIAARPKSAPRPDDGEIGLVSDLALALLCTSATHVPDHWAGRTPIEGGPRHELLLFRPGSHARRERGFDLLVLDRADPAPISLPAGRHALVAGIAGRHGSGAWRLIASDALSVEVPAGGALRLALDARSALRGSRMTGYRVEQVFSLEPDPASAAAPAAPAPGGPPS